MIGNRYGRLCVIRRHGVDKKRHITWECICDCGNITVVAGTILRSGKTLSCGCLRYEKVMDAVKTHGRSSSSEYNTWCHMMRRCYKAKSSSFKHYGARGITVAKEWHSFNNFYRDMGCRPSQKHSIERVDNDKGYSKDNCIWATAEEQAKNTRRTVMLEFNETKLCVSDWAKLLGVNPHTLYSRINLGWDTSRVLSTPVRGSR